MCGHTIGVKLMMSLLTKCTFLGTFLFLLSSAFGQAIYTRKVLTTTVNVALDQDDIALANASGGDITFTLPDAQGLPGGRHYTIKRTDNNTATVVKIVPKDGTGQNIDGQSSYTMVRPYQEVRVVTSDVDSNWHILDATPRDVLNANAFPGADIGLQINNAINALPAVGGTVVISPGTYEFSHQIVLNNKNITLTGAGDGYDPSVYCTRLVWTGGGLEGPVGVAISVSNPTGVSVTMRLSNFSLIANSDSNPTGTPGAVGIDVDNGANHTIIEHVTMYPATKPRGFSVAGIRLGNTGSVVDVTLRDVIVANNKVGLQAKSVGAGVVLDHARIFNSLNENVQIGCVVGPAFPQCTLPGLVQAFHSYGGSFEGNATDKSSIQIIRSAMLRAIFFCRQS